MTEETKTEQPAQEERTPVETATVSFKLFDDGNMTMDIEGTPSPLLRTTMILMLERARVMQELVNQEIARLQAIQNAMNKQAQEAGKTEDLPEFKVEE